MAVRDLIAFGVVAAGAWVAWTLTRGRALASTSGDFFGGPSASDTFAALGASAAPQPFFASPGDTAAPASPTANFFGDLFGFDLFTGGVSPDFGQADVPVFTTTATAGVSADVDTVARTIWGEARGGGASAMRAVAAVIMNRVRDRRWPSSPGAVATQPAQFSVWNHDDPNRPKILAVSTADAQFRTALQIASDAVAGRLADPTGGATHYYASRIAPPRWASGAHVSAQIGGHTFLTGVA